MIQKMYWLIDALGTGTEKTSLRGWDSDKFYPDKDKFRDVHVSSRPSGTRALLDHHIDYGTLQNQLLII